MDHHAILLNIMCPRTAEIKKAPIVKALPLNISKIYILFYCKCIDDTELIHKGLARSLISSIMSCK